MVAHDKSNFFMKIDLFQQAEQTYHMNLVTQISVKSH